MRVGGALVDDVVDDLRMDLGGAVDEEAVVDDDDEDDGAAVDVEVDIVGGPACWENRTKSEKSMVG